MIRRDIRLGKYDWDVCCFVGYDSGDAVYLCNELMAIGCCSKATSKAYRHFVSGGESSGLTYSNVKDKVSVVTIGHSEEESEMVNTIGHELLHVTAHICEAYNIDMGDEQACYIMGELCERIFKKVSLINSIISKL